MKELAQLAEQQEELEQLVAKLEGELKAAKRKLDTIAEQVLPAVMERLGLEQYSTNTGLEIEIEKKVRAGISKDNLIPALAWLREHGHANLIKRSLTIIPSNDVEGELLAKLLRSFDLSDMPSVHAQTLGKFVRELLAEGEDVPQDLFGIYYQPRAKVKR